MPPGTENYRNKLALEVYSTRIFNNINLYYILSGCDNKIITFSGLQKKSVLNKKNYLIPINKKSLHKINSTPNLLSNDSNNNNIFSTRQTYKNINFSRNNKLQTLKKSLNDSYNSK